MTGHEKHLREMIKGQQEKIARCLERIAEIENELSSYLSNIPPPLPPFSMPPKDDHDYCGKILYPSEKAAHKARTLINRDLKKKGKELIRRAYFCDRCEAWHLTTVPHWLPYPDHAHDTNVVSITPAATPPHQPPHDTKRKAPLVLR